MPNKMAVSTWLMIVLTVFLFLAGAPAWASADDSNSPSGDFKPPLEIARDDNPIKVIQPPPSLVEGNVLFAGKDKTDSGQDEFTVAIQGEAQRPVIPVSTACVAIGPVGKLGTLYLGIPRKKNGSCKVDLAGVGFYLNDAKCEATVSCKDNLGSGIPCRYPSPRDLDCGDDKGEGPCIDFSDVEAAVNVICAPDNAACNECINWETGSPTCTDYRTPLGVRIKMCVLENGETCPWKTCCKKKLLDDPRCQE